MAAAAAVTGPGHAAGLWPATGAGRPGQMVTGTPSSAGPGMEPRLAPAGGAAGPWPV